MFSVYVEKLKVM